MFCIWCDKLFFNKGNDIMNKFIQIHIKLAHSNEYGIFIKNKCRWENPQDFVIPGIFVIP